MTTDASYFWPVRLAIPASGGKTEKSTFEAQFKRINQSRLSELLKDEDAKAVDMCKEVVIGWRDVKDESKEDIAFTDTSFGQMLEIPGVAKAIVEAYLESIAGQKAKN
jgi:hypothetical protein